MPPSAKEPLLDLHGFTLEEVDDAVDRFLVQSNKRGVPRARIMTGKGTGAVQKAVAGYLKRAGYSFEHERLPGGKRNEGVLVVFMQ